MIKVIVAGGRDFNDYELLEVSLNRILSHYFPNIEIVSGCANGADKLGERYAESKCLPVKLFQADWDTHGKKAGYLRNKQMADYATHCVCFWDGKSKGTNMMIEIANLKKMPVRVIRYDLF